VDGSVFVKHYYRPLIKELRDRVLSATAKLEKELLPLLELPTILQFSSVGKAQLLENLREAWIFFHLVVDRNIPKK